MYSVLLYDVFFKKSKKELREFVCFFLFVFVFLVLLSLLMVMHVKGCNETDWVGFPAGHVAVVTRGVCPFGQKAQNGQAVGALGTHLV